MTFPIKNAIPGLFIIFIFITSCKKGKNEACPLNVSNLTGTYLLTALQYKQSSTAPEEDYMVFFDACEKDDHVRLNSNLTYDYLDVGLLCSPAGSDQGNWDLNGDVIISDGLIRGKIESFDCTTLITVMTDVYTTGDRLTFTLKKQ